MESYVEKKKQKIKKKLIKIGISIAIPILFIIVPMSTLMMLAGGGGPMIPSAADDVVAEYQEVATRLQLNWEEIMIYDMVTTDNEFTEYGPGPTSMLFFELHFKEYEEVEHKHVKYEMDDVGVIKLDDYGDPIPTGEVTYTYTKELIVEGMVASDSLYVYLGNHGYKNLKDTDIYPIIEAIESLNQNDLIELDYQSKTLYDYHSSFTDQQLEWMDMLLSENIMIKTYGNYYELPDYINVETDNLFAWPAPGNLRISSKYGWRTHPETKKRNHHNGTDIVGASAGECLGNPAIAAADGTVIQTRWADTGWGNTILIEHVDSYGFKWTTRYAHLAQIDVFEGDVVNMGSVIGAIGNSGTSTGPHLHFEVRYEGNLVNPEQLIEIP